LLERVSFFFWYNERIKEEYMVRYIRTPITPKKPRPLLKEDDDREAEE